MNIVKETSKLTYNSDIDIVESTWYTFINYERLDIDASSGFMLTYNSDIDIVEVFENFVNEVWREAPVDNSNAMINMMNKLKYLKKKIRVWNGMRQSPKTRKHVLKQELADLEMIIDKGDASSDTLHKRAEVVKSIQEVDKLCAMEASQKAKIKWAIEGDENSKYYHGILNKKRNQLSIRGVLVEGDWVKNPNMVKNELLKLILAEDGKKYSWNQGWLQVPCLANILYEVEPLKIKGFNAGSEEDCRCGIQTFHQENWDLGLIFFVLLEAGSGQDRLKDLTTYVKVLFHGVTLIGWFPEVSTQTRWIKAVPIKVNIHAWKVRMDCLPTRLNISRRDLPLVGEVDFMDCKRSMNGFLDRKSIWILSMHKRLLEGVCIWVVVA
ncbi:hypothetical protein Tco_0783918 [Tanacetum coccineum]